MGTGSSGWGRSRRARSLALAVALALAATVGCLGPKKHPTAPESIAGKAWLNLAPCDDYHSDGVDAVLRFG